MLRKIVRAAVAVAFVLSASCNGRPVVHENREPELVGDWDLLLRHDCENYAIRSDHLTLHADGTFDQHSVLKDGQKVESTGQHWRYLEKDSVALSTRRDWEPHSDPNLKKSTDVQPQIAGINENEVLIVHFSSPPEILLNPDSDWHT